MKWLAPKPSLIGGPVGEFEQPGGLSDSVTATQDLFVIAHRSVAHVTERDRRLDAKSLSPGYGWLFRVRYIRTK